MSQLNLDRNQMARTDDKTSPERENPDKKHLKAVDHLPLFLCDQGNGGGHSKPNKECVVMTQRLLVRSCAMV